jgi:hypothetical protein
VNLRRPCRSQPRHGPEASMSRPRWLASLRVPAHGPSGRLRRRWSRWRPANGRADW